MCSYFMYDLCRLDFPGGSDGKESASNEGDPGSIPESGRYPGEGNDNPLQDSCLDNPMERGDWRLLFMESQRVRTNEQLTFSLR